MKRILEKSSLSVRIIFVVVPVVLALNLPIFYNYLSGLQRSETLVDQSYNILVELERLLSFVKDAETGQRGYLVTGDSRYLSPYIRAREELGHNRSTLRKLLAERPVDQKYFAEIETRIDQKLAELDRISSVRRKDGFVASRDLLASGLGERQMEELRSSISEMVQREERLARQRRMDSQASRLALNLSMIGLTLLDLFLLIVAYKFLKADFRNQTLAQERLIEAKEEAEKANIAKSRFLANMSHEIRTPLGVIIGFADLALSPNQSESERVNALMRVRKNAELLSELVNDILDLSKIEADKLDLEVVSVPIDEFLEDLAESMNFKAQAKGIKFLIETNDQIPVSVQTDPTRLRQILMNLVSNAIKFTESGFVKLSVQAERADGQVQLEFRVEDTGIGISPEQQSKLFKPFTQADSSTTRRFGGTGLGLALSKRLAELLGGELSLHSSEVGRGSVFTFSLEAPEGRGLARKEAKGKRATGVVHDFPLGAVRILLVDDSPDNQDLIGRVLRIEGAYVETADHGEEAVQKALAGNFDVVLMDVQMPIKDGFQATADLRNQNYSKPIIALTAHAMKEERDRALQSGFDAYLTKPLNRAQLIATVASFRRPPAPLLKQI